MKWDVAMTPTHYGQGQGHHYHTMKSAVGAEMDQQHYRRLGTDGRLHDFVLARVRWAVYNPVKEAIDPPTNIILVDSADTSRMESWAFSDRLNLRNTRIW